MGLWLASPAIFLVGFILVYSKSGIARMAGVAYTDIDETHSRLEIGYVAEDTTEEALREFVRATGVPLRAVRFVKTDYARQDLSLADRIRPVDGGVLIQFDTFGCTHGFNAALPDERRGFVTNSHCTRNQGGVENTIFLQPLGIVLPLTCTGTVPSSEKSDTPLSGQTTASRPM